MGAAAVSLTPSGRAFFSPASSPVGQARVAPETAKASAVEAPLPAPGISPAGTCGAQPS